MKERQAQFLNIVKTVFDKRQAYDDAEDLAVELQDRLGHVKVGLDKSGLKEFEEAFNAEMAQFGLQPIVLSNISIGDNTIKDMAKQITGVFVGAINNAMAGAIKSGVDGALAAIERLEKTKSPRIARRDELRNKTVEFESLQTVRTSSHDIHPHPLAKESDINEQARKIYAKFKDAKDALDGIDSIYDDAEYDKILDNYYDAVKDMYRMRQTIKNNMDELTDEKLKNKFKWSKLNKSVDEGFEIAGTSLNEYIKERTNIYEDEMQKLSAELTKIDNQIDDIKGKNQELIDQEMVNKTLKSLNEVEDALKRISNKTKDKAVKATKLNAIKGAIDYDDSDAERANNKNILGTLYGKYASAHQAVVDNDGAGWEEEYQWLLKFVKQYEWLEKNGQLSEYLKGEYGKYFEELSKRASNARESLISLRDMAEGKIQPQSSQDINAQNDAADAAQQQANAQIDAAKAAEAEADALRRLAEEQERARKEAEARLEAERKAAEYAKENERLLSKLSSTSNLDKEKFAYLNTETGHVSQHIEGEFGTVSKKAQQELLSQVAESVNATLHTHPEFVAAPSEDDIMTFAKNYALFKKNFILAGEQLAEIDFTGLSETQAMQLAEAYKKNVLSSADNLEERFNNTQFKNLGIEALDIDGILTRASEQLNDKFPDLQVDIDEFINKLGLMLRNVEIGDLTQDNLESRISDVFGAVVKDKRSDFAIDGFQLVVDTFNSASGIPSMYQEALLDIFKQTISSLNFDPAQIFKLYSVKDFDAELALIRQQSVDAYKKNAIAVEGSTDAHKKISESVPSEEEIKSGRATWRGMPIKYDASLYNEARNLTDYMAVGDKFFGADEGSQKYILDHEVAHNIADQIMYSMSDSWAKVADTFTIEKMLPKGANVSFYTEEDDDGNRWYREGLYGDLGATAVSETITQAITEYFNNPEGLFNRSGDAYGFIDKYLNQSGDTLDNVAKAKEELDAVEKLVDAKQTEQQIEHQTDAVIADNQKKIESYEKLYEAIEKVNSIRGQDDGSSLGNIETEQAKLQELESAVGKVTTAVDLKTQAFKDEEAVVATAVDTESAKIAELEERVLAIKSSLDGFLSGISSGNVDAIDQYINKFKELGDVLSLTKSQLSGLDEITQQTLLPILSQIASIKKAVDVVSKAVGRQNAGFIKGAKSVSSNIDSQKQSIAELIEKINDLTDVALRDLSLIGNAFARAFEVPEIDNSKFQDYFNSISSKFAELQNKIGNVEFGVGINEAEIVRAIQKALYSSDIAESFKRATFANLFEEIEIHPGQFLDLITGELLDKVDAQQRYNDEYSDRYIWKHYGDDRPIYRYDEVRTFDDVLNEVLAQKNDNSAAAQQENWAQIIVEEIRTQGNKIAEAIKLILPEGVSVTSELEDAFTKFTNGINAYLDQTGLSHVKDIFTDIEDGRLRIDELGVSQSTLRALGLTDDDGKWKGRVAGIGGMNDGVIIADNVVYHAQREDKVTDFEDLKRKQMAAYEQGAAVPKIIADTMANGRIFQLQERAPGVNLRHGGLEEGVLEATNEQLDKLIQTFKLMEQNGLWAEFGGDNIMYDHEKGFTMIDLDNDEKYWNAASDAKQLIDWFIETIKHIVGYTSQANDFIKRFEERAILQISDYEPKLASGGKPQHEMGTWTKNLLNAKTSTLARMAQSDTNNMPSFGVESVKTGDILPTAYPNVGYVFGKDGTDKFIHDDIKTYRELLFVISQLNDALDRTANGGQFEDVDKEAMFALKKQLGHDLASFDLFTHGGHFDPDKLAKELGIDIPQNMQPSAVSFNDDTSTMWPEFGSSIFKSTETLQATTSAIQTQNDALEENADNWKQAVDAAANGSQAVYDKAKEGIEGIGGTETLFSHLFATDPNSHINSDMQTEDFKKLSVGGLESNGTITIDSAIFKTTEPIKIADESAQIPTSTLNDSILQVLQNINQKSGNLIAQEDTLKEVKSKVDNIKSGRGKSADINPHIVTDPQGRQVELYRGIKNSYGGLVSNRYHGGTFSTSDIELAKQFAGELGKIEKMYVSMKNPLEIDGKGAAWDSIEYLGHGADEDSKALLALRHTLDATINEYNALRDQNIELAEKLSNGISDNADVDVQRMTDATERILLLEERMRELKSDMQVIFDDASNPYMRGTTNDIAEVAKQFGYDGVIFKQIRDGLQTPSDIFVTFEEDQIHYIETIQRTFVDAINTMEQKYGQLSQYIDATEKDITDAVNEFIALQIKMNGNLSSEGMQNFFDQNQILKQFDHWSGRSLSDILSQRIRFGLDFDVSEVTEGVMKFVNGIKTHLSDLQAIYSTNAISADEYEQTHKEVDIEDGDNPASLKQIVSTVLESIKANAVNAETNATDDSILTAIKTAVESINAKIVKGTKVIATKKSGTKKKETKKEEKATLDIKNPKELGNVKATMVPKEVKALEAEYARLGELQGFDDSVKKIEAQQLEDKLKLTVARLEEEGIINDTIKQRLDNIRTEAKVNQANLELAKKLKKEHQIDVREERKMARKEEGVSAANTAWNAGKRALGNTWKFEGMTDDEIAKIPQVQELTNSINDLGKKQSEVNLKIAKHQEILPEEVKELNKSTEAAKKHTIALNELVKNYEFFSGENAVSLGQKYSGGDLEQQLKQAITLATNGKAKFGEYDPVLKQWTYTVKGAGNMVEHFVGGLRQTDQELMRVHTSTKKTESMFEMIKRKTKEVFTYFSGSSLIYKVFNLIKQGIGYIKEIDSALVELRKVTNETEETYDKFLQTAAKTGQKLGTTISQVTLATATFAKLGYSMKMASEMAEAALVYKNVGDGIASADEAADSIISTLKGFNLEASEAMRIVDRFNEVGNKFAITSKGIGDALKLSASALSTAGNTLDESIALITGANEVVNDPSSVGTALKTLTLRLRGSKTELEEAGLDIENMANTTSQLQAKLLALTGGKVDIMLDANTFKSSTQILREMAAAWEYMTDVQRASALELMGGKRQANVLSALIQNFDTVESVIKASESSAGSALRENEVFLDSFEGRLQQLTNTVQSKWSEALDTDVIKDAIQLFTKLIDTLDFEDNALVDLISGLTKALSWLMDLLGNNNFGYTLIAFFGAKWAQNSGLIDFFKGIKKTGEDTIESLTNDIDALNKEIASLADKANKQSGLAQKNTLQQIDVKKELKKVKQERLDAMKLSEKEQKEVAETFDVVNMQNQINGKKGAITKRSKALESQGYSAEQIAADPKIQKWNQEIQDGQQKLDAYKEEVKSTDDALNRINETTSQGADVKKTDGDITAANTVETKVNESAQTDNSNARQMNTGATKQQGAAVTAHTKTMKINTAALKKLGKQMLQTFAYMAIIQGAMQILDGIAWGLKEAWNAIFPKGKSFEDLHKHFEQMSSDLDAEESELKNIENALEDVNKQILDIQSLDSLSFTSQEELENLQKQREELERMAEIQGILTKNQQKKTNAAALDAAKSYMKQSAETDKTLSEAAEKSKETGENIGSIVDGLLMVGGAAMMIGFGWTGIGAVAGGAMMAAGMAGAGKGVGGLIGENVGESQYKKQQTNQQAVDNYATRKAEYKQRMEDAFEKGDAVEYDKIKEEYDKFEVMMSDNIGGLMEYLNAVDYKTLTDIEKADYEAFQKIVNQYSLQNDGSITNAVNSILNYDRYQRAGYEMDEVQKKLKNGDLTEEEAKSQIQSILESTDGLEEEFTDTGIKIDDVVDSYVKLGIAARDNSSLMDSMDKVSAVTSAFDDLGDAVKEFREEGMVAVGTLESLNEKFGKLDGFEELYKVLATGEGNLEEAVTRVANAYVGQAGILTDMTDEELDVMVARLKSIGVLNAKEVLMARQKGQEQLDSLGLAYSIDLSNYGTAEQAKLAIAQMAGLKIADITDDNIKGLAEQYGVDLENYATTEEAKIAVAQARAKAEAEANKQKLDQDYKNGDITYSEYMSGITDVNNSLNFSSVSNVIQGIIDDAYKGFKFNFDGRVGIGSDFDEDTIDREAQNAFQKEMDYYENRIAANQAKYGQIQNEIDLLEAKGMRAGEEYYREQIKLEGDRKVFLEDQKAVALEYLSTLKEGSDEWWNTAKIINDIDGELDESTAKIQELVDAIGQLRWDGFDEVHKRFSNLTSDLENIRHMLSDEDMFDDQGNFTDAGVANLATYIQELEIYKNALAGVQEELADFQQGYEGNEDYFATIGIDSEQEYYDKLVDLTDKQDEYTKSIKDSEQSVVDMYERQIDAVEEYMSELVDGYNDYIDAVKEALDAERDLYDFKKNVKKQAKDIATLERRIASLSSSNNAADIAERRKLEAELYEAREGLNDTYYDHAKDAQSDALDKEAQAYEKAVNKFIDGLRDGLKSSLKDIDGFMGLVATAVITNAPSIKEQYENLGLSLDSAIIDPWTEAEEKIKEFGGADGLGIMNSWIAEGGDIYKFDTDATKLLQSPWSAGETAIDSFQSAVKTGMEDVVEKVESNVESAKNQLSELYEQIQDTETKLTTVTNNGGSGDNDNVKGYDNGHLTESEVKALQEYLGVDADGKWGSKSQAAAKAKWGVTSADAAYAMSVANKTPYTEPLKDTVKTTGKLDKSYYSVSGLNKASVGWDDCTITIDGTKYKVATYDSEDKTVSANIQNKLNELFGGQQPTAGTLAMYNKVLYVVSKDGGWVDFADKGDRAKATTAFYNKLNGYAKGTMGTSHDQLAITDESWIGEEITLAAGKNGQLQYLKKGSAVMPADISANLVEWGKLNPDMMKVGGGANINMISSAVNKPELNFEFDSLVHVDNCSQDTLKDLEKMVDNKINQFSKQMNYAIKRIGGR